MPVADQFGETHMVGTVDLLYITNPFYCFSSSFIFSISLTQ